ncbi:hypothetical protein CPB86DRAFT_306222 [Serendipita vermifera]|nr:hypothetical protein CPB86DRAFT_306222 [Serendipita vermifera]
MRITEMHGRHARILRLSLDNRDIFLKKAQNKLKRMLTIIRLCPEIQRLALYHAPADTYKRPDTSFFTNVIEPFLVSSKYRNLDSIGVYSSLSSYYCPEQRQGIQKQMNRLANSERASLLKKLTISLPFLSKDDVEVIRTKFTCLKQLTIHRNLLEHFLASGPSTLLLLNWSHYTRLTTLQLTGYGPASYAWSTRLSDVVRTSISLTHLFISDMGTFIRDAPPIRRPGWGVHGDGWWNRRKPLDGLHIKATRPLVVYHLGTIPVSNVKLTLPKFKINENSFVRDEEIFPQMQKMTMMNFSPRLTEYSSRNPDILIYAQVMCTKRGVFVEHEGASTFEEVNDPILNMRVY